VKRTRIVVAGMSGVMLELMKAILAAQPEFHVAGRVPVDDGLVAAMRHYRADVLVLMQPSDDKHEVSAEQMFWRRPSKIVTITSDGQDGTVYVLRPHATPLRGLSVDVLVNAIRSAGSDG
jgi:hypothetical protein